METNFNTGDYISSFNLSIIGKVTEVTDKYISWKAVKSETLDYEADGVGKIVGGKIFPSGYKFWRKLDNYHEVE